MICVSARARMAVCLCLVGLATSSHHATASPPVIDQQFAMHIAEIDDTDGGSVSLRQLLAVDPMSLRSVMVADGDAVNGHIEQIVDCSHTMGGNGFFLDISGQGPQQQCTNYSRTCNAFQPFWSFPSNTSYLGKSRLPGAKGKASFQMYSHYEYWDSSERYEFYAHTPLTGSATPVWLGKVFTATPGYHLFHFEYTNYTAGPPPASLFDPPPGTVCTPPNASHPLPPRGGGRGAKAGLPLLRTPTLPPLARAAAGGVCVNTSCVVHCSPDPLKVTGSPCCEEAGRCELDPVFGDYRCIPPNRLCDAAHA